MRGAAAAALCALGLAASGCIATSLRTFEGGKGTAGAPRKDSVLLVGYLHVVPTVQQKYGGSTIVLTGQMVGNFFASFTPDLRSPYRRDHWPYVERAETAWMPMDGPFFIEVPARRQYLRGLMVVTDHGYTHVDLTLELDVRPGDEVVYVGHVHLVRVPPAKIAVKDRHEEFKEGAPADLLRRKWVTRLAEPVDDASEGRIRVELPSVSDPVVIALDESA